MARHTSGKARYQVVDTFNAHLKDGYRIEVMEATYNYYVLMYTPGCYAAYNMFVSPLSLGLANCLNGAVNMLPKGSRKPGRMPHYIG